MFVYLEGMRTTVGQRLLRPCSEGRADCSVSLHENVPGHALPRQWSVPLTLSVDFKKFHSLKGILKRFHFYLKLLL